jgi:hypothetical protein
MADTHAEKRPFWESHRNQRIALWIGLGILMVGVAVATFRFFGNTGTSLERPLSEADAQLYVPRKQMKVDAAARRVAGEWILTSVARKNLAEGYRLTHPELRQGMTLKQWLTGNIPVQPYPADQLDQARFKVDESYEDEVYLEVALLPKAGVTIKPQIFFIGLKRLGGKKGPWRVSYWLPYGKPELPTPRE